MSDVYIGRQPIMSDAGEVFGFELLFRTMGADHASISDDVGATARILTNMMNTMGVRRIIGDRMGFINVNHDFLMDDVIDLIPRDRFVLEVLETTRVDAALLRRMRELKSQGFTFALDDVIFTDAYIERFQHLLPFMSYLKVEVPETDVERLHTRVDLFRKFPVKLLAEKVETQRQYETCKRFGFSFYQGYFFARPAVIASRALDPSTVSIMEIMRLLSSDADIRYVEDAFKKNPVLDYNLLRFINSAAIYLAGQVTSIRHALNLLGRRKLSCWVLLLMYAGSQDELYSPIISTAMVRGKCMELLCDRLSKSHRVDPGEAFLVGLLSVMDAVFQRPMKDLLDEMNLSERISDAVLHNAGTYGELLQLVQAIEQMELTELADHQFALDLSASDLNDAWIKAFSWLEESKVRDEEARKNEADEDDTAGKRTT